MNKNELFASARPAKALAVMALPTVASQMILLIYNHVFGLSGLIWSQIVADFINAINAFVVFTVVRKKNGLVGKEINS